MRAHVKAVSHLVVSLSVGLSSMPAFAMENKAGSQAPADPEIRFDELNAWLTFNSELPLADVIAAEMSIDEYKETNDFATAQGLDLDTIEMGDILLDHAQLSINGNKMKLNGDHSVKIGDNVMRYDSSKSGYENWKRFYDAAIALPVKKPAPKSTSISIWSRAIAAIFGERLSFAADGDNYEKDPASYSTLEKAGAYLSSFASAAGTRLYNAAVGTMNGSQASGEAVTDALVGQDTRKKLENTAQVTGASLAQSGQNVADVVTHPVRSIEQAGSWVGTAVKNAAVGTINGAAADGKIITGAAQKLEKELKGGGPDVPARASAALGATAGLTWSHQRDKGSHKEMFNAFKGRLVCNGSRYALMHKMMDHSGVARVMAKHIPEDMLGAALKLKGKASSCTPSTLKSYNQRLAQQSDSADGKKLQKHVAAARNYAHHRADPKSRDADAGHDDVSY